MLHKPNSDFPLRPNYLINPVYIPQSSIQEFYFYNGVILPETRKIENSHKSNMRKKLLKKKNFR